MPFNPPTPDPKGRSKGSGLVSAIVQAEKLVQIALILPSAAFIGWLGGAWLGGRLHHPWIAAVGVAFGGAAGLYYVVRLAMDSLKDMPPDDDAGKDDNGKGSSGKNE
jgi:ATP synthase protein I